MSLEDIRKKLVACKQLHLLNFWDDLTTEQQDSFLKQMHSIDFNEANDIFTKAQSYLTDYTQKLEAHMKPIPSERFESEKGIDQLKLEQYRRRGLAEIASSHVAVLLLAGGQGTRLGVPYPKGMSTVGLPSGKTLFQIQAERIRRAVKLAKEETGKIGRICWYIMTSHATDDDTKKYLQNHKYFGLNEEDVVIFQQGLMPCFSFDGKIILEKRHMVALAPDGNGGLYKALKQNDIIQDMADRNIKYVHVHSVDNVLVKVADPIFIGYSVSKGADCGAKVVQRKLPAEPIGVICRVGETFHVVEYSEITTSTAALRDEEGNLLFRAGNICNHFFTTNFLRKVSQVYENQMKLHVARKKIPYIDCNGELVHPTAPNGIKIEKFIFDVFQYSENFVTWEVPRDCEFSPLKNSESVEIDCPSTARRDLLRLHKTYVEKAGGTVTCEEIEISPLASYAGENLTDKVYGKVFDRRTIIYSDEELLSHGVCACVE